MQEISDEVVLTCLERIIDVIHENRQYLTDLDAAIGDADHGSNMDRGFQAVRVKLAEADTTDIGAVLKLVATTLISTVGGASGPLYGTAFLRAGTALTGKGSLTMDDVLAGMDAFVEGAIMRGKATTGEKTMLDALVPANVSLKAAAAEGKSIAEAVAAAADAADAGVQATIPMIASKGRASYLGDRSRGHQDPGATSSALMLRTIATVLAGSLA